MTIQRQKEILISVFVVLYSLLFFMGVVLYSGLGVNRTGAATAALTAGALLWCALIVTATAMAVNRSGTSGIIVGIPPLLLVILGKFTLDAFVGAVLAALLLLALQRKITWEVNNHIRFRVTTVLYESVRLAIYTLLVAVITLSLPSIIQGFKSDHDVIPAKYFTVASRPLEPIIARWLPGYQTDNTIDQVIAAQVEQQTGGLVSADNPLLAGQIAAGREQFARQFGVSVRGDETISAVATRLLNDYIYALTQKNRYFTAAIVIIVTFIAMRVIVPILIWPVLAVIKGFFYVANRIGLVSFIKTTVEAERFTL